MADLPGDPPGELRAGAQPQLRLAFDVALWRQQEQVDRARSLDGKLGQTLGLNAAMIAVFGSAVLFAADVNLSEIGLAVQIAAGLFIANVIVSAAAFVVGSWTFSPDLDELLKHAETLEEDEMLRRVIATLIRAVQANGPVLSVKEALVALAIALTAATAVVIAAAAIAAAA